jgi:hypothetical protein
MSDTAQQVADAVEGHACGVADAADATFGACSPTSTRSPFPA